MSKTSILDRLERLEKSTSSLMQRMEKLEDFIGLSEDEENEEDEENKEDDKFEDMKVKPEGMKKQWGIATCLDEEDWDEECWWLVLTPSKIKCPIKWWSKDVRKARKFPTKGAAKDFLHGSSEQGCKWEQMENFPDPQPLPLPSKNK